jgi:hypothetical protein
MNTTTFPPKIYPQAEKSDRTLSVSAQVTWLSRLADLSRLKAYIQDHEAWALVLVAVLLIAGTVLYVDFQPRLIAKSEPTPSNAALKLAEATVPMQPSDELSSALVQETPSIMSSSISNPSSQPVASISSRKRDNRPLKRRVIHHHHRR